MFSPAHFLAVSAAADSIKPRLTGSRTPAPILLKPQPPSDAVAGVGIFILFEQICVDIYGHGDAAVAQKLLHLFGLLNSCIKSEQAK